MLVFQLDCFTNSLFSGCRNTCAGAEKQMMQELAVEISRRAGPSLWAAGLAYAA